MVLQHIYGRDPVIGYCDKKYSKSLDSGEVLTKHNVRLSKKIVNAKINYILPQYLYGDLPSCYYLIQKAGYVIYGKSSYVEAGRGEYINHNYIFTDTDKAFDIFSGKSIFDTNIFLSRIEQADDYDIENAIFSKNIFDVSTVAKTLESLGIGKYLFEKIMFALIESVCLGTRVFIVPKNMDKKFTDDITALLKAVFYVLPKSILSQIGFITYFNTFPSLSNTLDGSIRLVCIEKTAENIIMFGDVLDGGNFIFQLDGDNSEVFFPAEVDTSGLAVTQLFSGAIFDNAGIAYKKLFESQNISPSNTYLLYINYICSKHTTVTNELMNEIAKIMEQSVGFDDLFKKFAAVTYYYEPDIFTDILYNCVSRLLESSKYSNISELSKKIFDLQDDNSTDQKLANQLNNMVYFFVGKYMGAINFVIDMGDTAADQILLWSERLLSYISKPDMYKISSIQVYKRLKASIQKLSPDCINIYLIADPGVRKKIAYDIEHLTSLYIKNSDTERGKIFYLILPVLLGGYLASFNLAWSKGGLQELIHFIAESRSNSLLYDLDNGQLSLSEIEDSLRSFFSRASYMLVLEKAAKADSKVKAFAKKYRLL